MRCRSATWRRLPNFLDDDVVWTISGPVDILPFCGQRVGKGLVMKLLGPRLGLDGGGQRDSHTLLSERRFVAKTMLVDDRAAVLGRLTATKRASGQAISYRIAHFIQFRDEKVVDYVSIIDCFDADEQLLGYNLHAYGGGRRRHSHGVEVLAQASLWRTSSLRTASTNASSFTANCASACFFK